MSTKTKTTGTLFQQHFREVVVVFGGLVNGNQMAQDLPSLKLTARP